MPTPKNDASINLLSSFNSKVPVSIKEEKPMRFQYVCDKDSDFFEKNEKMLFEKQREPQPPQAAARLIAAQPPSLAGCVRENKLPKTNASAPLNLRKKRGGRRLRPEQTCEKRSLSCLFSSRRTKRPQVKPCGWFWAPFATKRCNNCGPAAAQGPRFSRKRRRFRLQPA